MSSVQLSSLANYKVQSICVTNTSSSKSKLRFFSEAFESENSRVIFCMEMECMCSRMCLLEADGGDEGVHLLDVVLHGIVFPEPLPLVPRLPFRFAFEV